MYVNLPFFGNPSKNTFSRRLPTAMASPKPHAVLIPEPAQGHVTPLLQLAKILHHRGFQITFVNSDYNHRRFLKSRGPTSLDGIPGFRFAAIPDGLPPSEDEDVTQDIPQLCLSQAKHSVAPFRELLLRLNSDAGTPPVSCVVADGVMTFAQRVAEEMGIPAVVFWTTSACGFMAYLHFAELIKRGYVPLKDESYLNNGYLETPIDWIPGMPDIRLKDFPSFIRTTDPNDIMLNFDGNEAQNARTARGLILNTFDELERSVIQALGSIFPNLYTIGPLPLFLSPPTPNTNSIGSNLWKEDLSCLQWLDKQDLGSVLYVNFGSITVVTADQLREFAWGLKNSGFPFLWIMRPDLVRGHEGAAADEVLVRMEEDGRGKVAAWCVQEEVLGHGAVGVFLTHCGWNSTVESICGGVPMICWPFFAEQQTNCRYVCGEWGLGVEIEGEVRREKVEGIVREVMEGEKGREMRVRAREWKERGRRAAEIGGSSSEGLERLVSFLRKRCN
ncbi:7-deoxyloganetin glucosyltransferase-like [Phalaenopsis equestris]|uniref:7-deoxyloganetin glucosyltransferase-like n=1 Tax=Phalaenopsis equestris TaxID=78828 RepID=UPI0009E385FA|nr:7-deoxyloganetin glucosyltransferase-like [Phalaenopsis equestris]